MPKKCPFCKNFLCNILLHMQRDFWPSYTLYIEIQCPPHKDKKTKSVYLSAVEIRLISHFKALLTHCKNSRMILRPPLETFLGPLKIANRQPPDFALFPKIREFWPLLCNVHNKLYYCSNTVKLVATNQVQEPFVKNLTIMLTF